MLHIHEIIFCRLGFQMLRSLNLIMRRKKYPPSKVIKNKKDFTAKIIHLLKIRFIQELGRGRVDFK